jgi:hypothetical protein
LTQRPSTLTDADSGTALDDGSVAVGGPVDVADAETGTGTESQGIVVHVSDSDFATAAESDAIAPTFFDDDTGTALDAEAIDASLTDADLAAFLETEELAVAFADDDTATGTEDGSVIARGPGPHEVTIDSEDRYVVTLTDAEHADVTTGGTTKYAVTIGNVSL